MTQHYESVPPGSRPYLWRWITEFGTVEFGHCPQTDSFIRVLDEGGLVWKGCRSYSSLDAALADAEAGIAQWMKNELGITADVGVSK